MAILGKYASHPNNSSLELGWHLWTTGGESGRYTPFASKDNDNYASGAVIAYHSGGNLKKKRKF